MGWRFRKSFSPIPGVRLTLSPRGLTTSVGAGPFRITSGSHGVGVTARIPGTVIAYHQHLTVPTSARQRIPLPQIPDEPRPPLSVAPAITEVEISSAGTSELTTEGLAAFKEVLLKAQQEQRDIGVDLRIAKRESSLLRCRAVPAALSAAL